MISTTHTEEDVPVAFNDYLTSVLNRQHGPNFLNIMGPQIQETAFLFPVTAEEVMSTMISLNNATYRDVDGLHIRPLKYVAATIVPVLEHTNNQIFSCGQFSCRLQVTK